MSRHLTGLSVKIGKKSDSKREGKREKESFTKTNRIEKKKE